MDHKARRAPTDGVALTIQENVQAVRHQRNLVPVFTKVRSSHANSTNYFPHTF